MKIDFIKFIKIFISPNWIAAISTLGLFILAFYGLFFTTIPETMVAALNEEISVLRVEKATLKDQLSELDNKKNQYALENQDVRKEIENLKCLIK